MGQGSSRGSSKRSGHKSAAAAAAGSRGGPGPSGPGRPPQAQGQGSGQLSSDLDDDGPWFGANQHNSKTAWPSLGAGPSTSAWGSGSVDQDKTPSLKGVRGALLLANSTNSAQEQKQSRRQHSDQQQHQSNRGKSRSHVSEQNQDKTPSLKGVRGALLLANSTSSAQEQRNQSNRRTSRSHVSFAGRETRTTEKDVPDVPHELGTMVKDYRQLPVDQVVALVNQYGMSNAEIASAACERLKVIWREQISQSSSDVQSAVKTLVALLSAHSSDMLVAEQTCIALQMLCLGRANSVVTDEAAVDSDDDVNLELLNRSTSTKRTTRDSYSRAERYTRSTAGGLTSADLAQTCFDAGAASAIVSVLQDERHANATSFIREAFRGLGVMIRIYNGTLDEERPSRQRALLELEVVGVAQTLMALNLRSEAVTFEGSTTMLHLLEPSSAELAQEKLAIDVQSRKQSAIDANVVPLLIRAMVEHATSSKVQYSALRLLASLVSRGAPEESRVIMGEAVIEATRACGKFPWHHKICKYSCLLIYHCVEADDDIARLYTDEITHSGGLQYFVDAARTHTSHRSVLFASIQAVHVLCRGHDAKAAARKQHAADLGATSIVLEAMSRNDVKELAPVQEHACGALAAICSGTGSKAIDRKGHAGKQGAVAAVLRALTTFSGEAAVSREACRAFAQLTHSHGHSSKDSDAGAVNRRELAKAGGLEIVLEAMTTHEDEDEVQEQCALVLAHLCHGTDIVGLDRKQAAADAGAISRIVQALEKFTDSIDTVAACCLAISTICTGSDEDGLERKQIAAEEGAIELVMSPLKSTADVKAQERICSMLRNLCTGQDDQGIVRKRRARDAGAVAVIEDLLSANPDAKTLTETGRGALRNITGGGGGGRPKAKSTSQLKKEPMALIESSVLPPPRKSSTTLDDFVERESRSSLPQPPESRLTDFLRCSLAENSAPPSTGRGITIGSNGVAISGSGSRMGGGGGGGGHTPAVAGAPSWCAGLGGGVGPLTGLRTKMPPAEIGVEISGTATYYVLLDGTGDPTIFPAAALSVMIGPDALPAVPVPPAITAPPPLLPTRKVEPPSLPPVIPPKVEPPSLPPVIPPSASGPLGNDVDGPEFEPEEQQQPPPIPIAQPSEKGGGDGLEKLLNAAAAAAPPAVPIAQLSEKGRGDSLEKLLNAAAAAPSVPIAQPSEKGRGDSLEKLLDAAAAAPSPAAEPPSAAVVAASPPEAPLREGWTPQEAPDGRTYYYHKASNVTQWERPEVEAAEQGPSSSETVSLEVEPEEPRQPSVVPITQPSEKGGPSPAAEPSPSAAVVAASPPEAPLREGWTPLEAPDGRTYYYHKASNVTQWERPEVEAAEEGPSSSEKTAAARAAAQQRRQQRRQQTAADSTARADDETSA